MSVYSSEQIEININAKNDLNQSMQLPLSFGISPAATDVLDKDLNEMLLPPAPFVGFYAAFEFIDSTQKEADGSVYYDRIWTNKDLRHTPENQTKFFVRHKMIFRFGYGKKISINWNKTNIPEWVDSLFIRDGLNGIVINYDMKKVDSMSWSNDGIKELYIHAYYSLQPTSVAENIKKVFQVYPNPTSSNINIVGENMIDKIELIDLFGRVLISDKKLSMNLSNFPNGLYYLKIYSGNEIYFDKLIKN
jgi:hypothetical protein